MIYLDYSATTPELYEVSEAISKTSKEFFGNTNSLNALGRKSSALLNKAKEQLCESISCNPNELTFTSGATEANNMALIGVAIANFKRGKHIITSKLEHPSIYSICDYLTSIGFTIDYVNNNEEGLIDFDHLKSLIREDTILVSICAVNSELGIRQPLKIIRQLIKKENPNTHFHSDITQALGKVAFNVVDVDLASASSHKIYGPKGIGFLYKKENVKLKQIIYGSGKSNDLKPGTIPLPLIVGFSKAARIATTDIEKRNSYILRLNEKIKDNVKNKRDVLINSTKYSIPQILNVSFLNIKPETLIRAMDAEEIYLSTNTACSSGELSRSIMEVYHDKSRAGSSIRISISHLTTLEEINKFLKYLDSVYEKLNGL